MSNNSNSTSGYRRRSRVETPTSILITAIRNGSIAEVQRIVANGGDLDLALALDNAILYGKEGIAIYLLSVGADFTTPRRGITPLMNASDHGLANLVNVLISNARVNVNLEDRFGKTALLYACIGAHDAIAVALINAGARTDINNNGESVLDICTRNNMPLTIAKIHSLMAPSGNTGGTTHNAATSSGNTGGTSGGTRRYRRKAKKSRKRSLRKR